MSPNLLDRLYQRELGQVSNRYTQVRRILGDRKWIDDLDIVNELSGHSGCVNALSWSKSGTLLASGSDDQYVNLHSYQPEDTTSQFKLTTTISTGHTKNIFSVKFMPHSNDRTLVSCAGDAEVRIFDLEYTGRPPVPPADCTLSTPRRRRRVALAATYEGVRYLSEGDTNCKVFRSHGERVKRIVTEDSPYLFLTCSEDGEVRQWDLRQPEDSYPAPRIGRRYASAETENVPLPLISYKKYNLDLNTISCAPSRPHYIALGGAHLHCFLHDRRMIGRDRLAESGRRLASPSAHSEHDDDLMGQATRCVRKFAPNGRPRMKNSDSGHITACKISDADPNELIVSWSSDDIYSFDMMRSPEPSEKTASASGINGASSSRVKKDGERKRKRKPGSMNSDLSKEGASRGEHQARRRGEGVSLRVQYENGQEEEIPIASSPEQTALLSPQQRIALELTRKIIRLRQHIFTLQSDTTTDLSGSSDPSEHTQAFTDALKLSLSILETVEEVMRQWRYPNTIDPDEIHYQQSLRAMRGSVWRLVQATGVLARVLGADVTDINVTQLFDRLDRIKPAPREDSGKVKSAELFGFDFTKAILLWLESGLGGLIRAFQLHSENLGSDATTDASSSSLSSSGKNTRFPIPADAGVDAIDEVLYPYLLKLGDSSKGIQKLGVSRFARDELRYTFRDQKDAVSSFIRAIKIPFQDLNGAAAQVDGNSVTSDKTTIEAQDRHSALKFWGFTVARGLLLSASAACTAKAVDEAFGGSGELDDWIREAEEELEREHDDIDPEEQEDVARRVEVVNRPNRLGEAVRITSDTPIDVDHHLAAWENAESSALQAMNGDPSSASAVPLVHVEGADEDEEIVMGDSEDEDEDEDEDEEAAAIEEMLEEDDEEDDDDDDGEENDSNESDDENTPFMFHAFRSGRHNDKVEADVPCLEHTRVYRGHCNVKTVKDVNFFGLQDEYVVSGSDDGNLFIWDKKTAQLVNILEGDGEVVNVATGHPYEPTLAVSGIDHTIKIFSPDVRARDAARKGIGVTAADSSNFSSIQSGRMRRRSRARVPNGDDEDDEGDSMNDPSTQAAQASTSEPALPSSSLRVSANLDDSEDESYVSTRGLTSRRRMHQEYEITSNNENNRRGTGRETFITRSMIFQLAARLRQRHALELGEAGALGEEGGEGEDGATQRSVVLSDDCTIM